MLQQFVSTLKDDARAAARAAAFSSLGAVFTLIGLGFLTVALWLLLASMESALFAATVIGALYCAAGFTFLALGLSSRRTASERSFEFKSSSQAINAASAPREPFVQMAEGFAMGMQAGRSARTGTR